MADGDRAIKASRLASDSDSERNLAKFAAAARRRLGHIGVREALRRSSGPLMVLAGVGALARPLCWPIQGGTMADRSFRALVIAAGIALMGILIVIFHAWRKRPSLLTAARTIDSALGLAEVVATGFSFERDQRQDEMARFAMARAHRVVADVDVDALLEPSATPSRKRTRWLVGGLAALVLGLGGGTVDRAIALRLAHPPTERELDAAKALARAAERAKAEPRELTPEQKRATERILEAARRASEAAAKGDRDRARDALDDMRRATRELEEAERAQARSLRSLRDELEGGAGSRSDSGEGRPSTSASEAMAKLAKELARGGSDEAVRKLLERLERAESRARSEVARARAEAEKSGASGKSGGSRESAWSRAAQALKEAREAAARGDAEGAKRAMERAEAELAAMEKAAAAGEGMTRIAEEGSSLDRSMHAAMSHDPSGGRRGEVEGRSGPGKDSGGASSKQAAAGKGDEAGAPGSGPGTGERSGPEQRRVNVDGNLQARADVRTGERAVSAIRGVGRGGDPRAYAEIFPSYDTVVEDGLREDVVPAARRPAVRRYFDAIRPGSNADEDRK